MQNIATIILPSHSTKSLALPLAIIKKNIEMRVLNLEAVLV